MGTPATPGQAVSVANAVMLASAAARAAVIATLRGQFVSALNFNLGRIAIRPADYAKVATAVERGYITVTAHVDRVNWADYDADNANFDTPIYPAALSLSDRSLLVHESTHALFHVNQIDAVEEEFESAAYIAQAIYSIRSGVTGSGTPPPDRYDLMSWEAWIMVWQEAFRLAQVARQTHVVTDKDARRLYNALQFTSFYRGLRGRQITYKDVKPVFPGP